MSLNRAERDQTAREFEANLKQSGLTINELQQKSGLSSERFMSAFVVAERGADPRDVWLIRDLLETAVAQNGAELVPFSKLTDDARSAAAGWFGIKKIKELR